MKYFVYNYSNQQKMGGNILLRFMCLTFLLLCCGFLLSNGQQTCSAYFYPGYDDVDIKFAAILGIQDQIDGSCTGQYSEPILKRAIAMNWVMDLLNGGNNASQAFIPGIRFGIDVYDDCHSEYLAARHAGAIASYILRNNECDVRANASQPRPPIAGVIGTSSSQTTTVVVDIMKQTNVPVVGVSATLPELSNKTRYPAFVRTIPSDLKQAQVIIEIAKELQWSYIIGVHTNDNYGIQGMAEVKRLALENFICVSKVEEFQLGTTPSPQQMESFVRFTLFTKIDSATGSIGVIYFGSDGPLKVLLNFIKANRSRWSNAMYYLQKIHWIATDGVMPTQELGDLVKDYNTKILLLGPLQLELNSFEEYFKNLLQEPPAWLTGQWRLSLKYVVENTYRCVGFNFSKDSLCDISNKGNPNGYMTAALDAIYLLANTLKTIFKATCDKKPDLCPYFKEILHTGLLKTNNLTDLNYGSFEVYNVPPEFKKLARSLKKVNGDFVAVNQTLFSIKANKDSSSFVEIGSYNSQKVNIYDTSKSIVEPSQCKGKCAECLQIGDMDYKYSHGKYLIIGLFSIHRYSDNNPFGCGEYRAQSLSYIASQAFLTAIGYLKNMTELDFGYLLMDDCYNPLMTSQKLIKMLSKELLVLDQTTGAVFDPKSVVVVIGAQSSIVTMALLPILQHFGIAMISYSATNPALDNTINDPFFLRTVSTDIIQARAIVSILIELNASRVGVIVINNMYGLGLYDLFRTHAEAENICVDNPVKITENTDSKSLAPVLKRYRTEEIKVVVTIVTDETAGIILDAVNYDDVFVFIATEGWGPNPLIMESRRRKARGALVLASYSPELPDYGLKKLLKSMDPYSESNNGWLRDLWQQQFQCNLPGGFNNIYPVQCPQQVDGTYLNDSILTTLVKQPLSVHTIIATLSAGLALKSLMDSQPVSSQPQNPDSSSLIKAIGSFQLTLSTGSLQNLSKAGFQIYNIQHTTSGYDYTNVGTFSGNGTLRLKKELIKFYNELGQSVDYVISSCQGRTSCLVCGLNLPTTTPTAQASTLPNTPDVSNSNDGVITALAVIIAVLCLVIIAAVLLVVLRARGITPCNCDRSYSAPKPKISNSPVPPSSLNLSADSDDNQTSQDSGNRGRPGLPPRKSETPKIPRNANVGDGTNANLSDLSSKSVISLTQSMFQQKPMSHRNSKASDTESMSMNEFPPPKAHSPFQNNRPNCSSSSGSGISQAPDEVTGAQSKKPTQEVQPLHPSIRSDTSGSGLSGSSGDIVYTTVRPTTLGEEVQTVPRDVPRDVNIKTPPDLTTSPEYLYLLNSVPQQTFSPPGVIKNSGQQNFVYMQTPEGIFLVAIPPRQNDSSLRDNSNLPPEQKGNEASPDTQDPTNPDFAYDNEGYITPLESPYHFFQHPITFLPSSDYGRRQDFTAPGGEGALNSTSGQSKESFPGQLLNSPGQNQGSFVPLQQFDGTGAFDQNSNIQGTFMPQPFPGVGAVNQNGQLQVNFMPQQFPGVGAVNKNNQLQGKFLPYQNFFSSGGGNQNNQLQGMYLPQQPFFLQYVNPHHSNIAHTPPTDHVSASQQNVTAMVHPQASGAPVHQRPNSLTIRSDNTLIQKGVSPAAANSHILNRNVQESPGVLAVQNTPQGKLFNVPPVIAKDIHGNNQNIQGINKGSTGPVRSPPGSTKVQESTESFNGRADTAECSPVVSSPAAVMIHPGQSRHLDVVEEVDDSNVSMI